MNNFLTDPIVQQFIDNPSSILEIQQANISEEMAKQPSTYGRIAYLYSIARRFTNTCKIALDIKYSKIYRLFRADNAEKTCDTYVKDHPEYIKIKQLYVDAEHEEFVLKALLDSLQQKKDMLIQHGAMLRQEMVTRISVMDDQTQSFFGRKEEPGN
jgi:hypothetical protein